MISKEKIVLDKMKKMANSMVEEMQEAGIEIPQELLERMGKANKDDIGTLVKTIPMKPSWIKMHKDIHTEADKLQAEKEALEKKIEKLDAKKDIMWGTIEADTKLYKNNFRITEDGKFINIYSQN